MEMEGEGGVSAVVVAGGDGAPIFQSTEHIFNFVFNFVVPFVQIYPSNGV
jgi:hypothetical protein